MDPMNGIFALYGLVDAKSQLDIYFTYTFKLKSGFWAIFKKIFKRVWEPKKESEDGTPIKKVEEIKPEIF